PPLKSQGKIILLFVQVTYLSEVYDLSTASESLKESLQNNNCVAVDIAGNCYLHYGNVNGFIEMLIFDLKQGSEI
ncbi:MAG: hypothetical protein OSJ55_10220, partial [Bacteroidales bacterium]|nr:hypothetical protein [Bacteroidales bacterium]